MAVNFKITHLQSVDEGQCCKCASLATTKVTVKRSWGGQDTFLLCDYHTLKLSQLPSKIGHQKCMHPGCPEHALPGFARRHGKCQYHWTTQSSGQAWADELVAHGDLEAPYGVRRPFWAPEPLNQEAQ